jgi:pSer/pThr/pTyr-binding forkhead associated (FHA) protein
MDVKLLVKKGSNGPHEIPLTTAETTVGRQKGCRLRVPSGTVSRQHCRFLFENERLYVEDLNSSNGTFVNGVRVYGKHMVQPGDEVEVGPVIFVANYLLVETGEAEAAVEGVPVAALDDDVFPVEGIPLAEEEPTHRGKVAPADDAVPVALVEEEEEFVAPAILDEELTLNTSGDADLRDLLSKMQ